MAKLNDKQKKKIIAERIDGATIRALANKYKVSTTTIQRVVNDNSDEIKQKVTIKNEENTQEILSYLDSQKEKACSIIGKILDEFDNEERIAMTPLNRLATVFGIVVDKFSATELTKPPQKEGNNLAEAISNSIKALGDDNDI